MGEQMFSSALNKTITAEVMDLIVPTIPRDITFSIYQYV